MIIDPQKLRKFFESSLEDKIESKNYIMEKGFASIRDEPQLKALEKEINEIIAMINELNSGNSGNIKI